MRKYIRLDSVLLIRRYFAPKSALYAFKVLSRNIGYFSCESHEREKSNGYENLLKSYRKANIPQCSESVSMGLTPEYFINVAKGVGEQRSMQGM